MLHNYIAGDCICDFEVYSDTVTAHSTCPLNTEPIKNANGEGVARCGILQDTLRLAIRVDDADKIAEVYCEAYGYAASVASGSLFSERIKGASLQEALSITAADLVHALSGLPRRRLRCAELPIMALRTAVQDYRSRGSVV